VLGKLDKEQAVQAYQKVMRGETPTLRERQALARYEKEREEGQRWEYYRAIPLSHWRKMAGKSANAIRGHFDKCGLPFGNDTIDLPAVVKVLHEFLDRYNGPVVRTRDAVAKHCGVSVRTVGHWIGQGMPGEPGKYDLRAIDLWRQENQPADKLQRGQRERERLLQIQLELQEIALNKARGSLIELEPVRRLFTRHIYEAKAILDQLPDRLLGCLPSGTADVVRQQVRQRARSAVDGAYTSLADSIAELGRLADEETA
jgi:phage terminase Nu1 subunit (DNA packaging protein)